MKDLRKNYDLTKPIEDQIGKTSYYISDQDRYKQYEVQRNNNFVFYVSGLNEKLGNIIDNPEDVLRISVSTSSVPHFKQTPITIKRGNSTIKYAGVPEWDSHSIDLDDFIGAETLEVLTGWQRLSYNERTDKVGLASDYKLDGYLLEYTPDYRLVRQLHLIGCWISGLDEDDFDHNSSDKHGIKATIEFDRAEYDDSTEL